ncbi:MAG: glycosyltransferase, partial [Victivallaceae bacterium]|nr:glycosyltransferase [Victivallaceae bacterium]
TDNSLAIINSYNDERIKLIKNRKNEGIIECLNLGLKLARGKYIVRMDADDISFPQRLELQYNYMVANKDVVLSGTYAEKISADGKYIEMMLPPTESSCISTLIYFSCAIIHPSVIFKKEAVINAGLYNPKNIHAEDYGLWVLLAKEGRMVNLPYSLLKYREHGENISIKKIDMQRSNAFNISYNTLNEKMQKKLDKESYKSFWYYWQKNVGKVGVKEIKNLNPLWDFAATLPAAKNVLTLKWYNLALKMIQTGNIATGLAFQSVLKKKFNISSGKRTLAALLRCFLMKA